MSYLEIYLVGVTWSLPDSESSWVVTLERVILIWEVRYTDLPQIAKLSRKFDPPSFDPGPIKSGYMEKICYFSARLASNWLKTVETSTINKANLAQIAKAGPPVLGPFLGLRTRDPKTKKGRISKTYLSIEPVWNVPNSAHASAPSRTNSNVVASIFGQITLFNRFREKEVFF